MLNFELFHLNSCLSNITCIQLLPCVIDLIVNYNSCKYTFSHGRKATRAKSDLVELSVRKKNCINFTMCFLRTSPAIYRQSNLEEPQLHMDESVITIPKQKLLLLIRRVLVPSDTFPFNIISLVSEQDEGKWFQLLFKCVTTRAATLLVLWTGLCGRLHCGIGVGLCRPHVIWNLYRDLLATRYMFIYSFWVYFV